MKQKYSQILRPFKEEIYKNIPANYLIIVGIYLINSRGEKCTFEKLIEECFRLFPKSFSFSRNPRWPDSLKFDRTLRKLREQGLVVGTPNTLFALTKFGQTIAQRTIQDLNAEQFIRTIKNIKPTRDGEINLIHNFKTNELFQRFLKDKKHFSITDMELRNLLHCTLETPLRIVKQNLSYIINLAKEFKEEELLQFLKICQLQLKKKKYAS